MIDTFVEILLNKIKDSIPFRSSEFCEEDFCDHSYELLDKMNEGKWIGGTVCSCYQYFSGASKGVLTHTDSKYVIKLPFKGALGGYDEDDFYQADLFTEFCEGWHGSTDYCMYEVEFYNNACEQGLEAAFAEVEILEEGIYIQEKAKIFSEMCEKTNIEYKIRYCSNGYRDYIDAIIRQAYNDYLDIDDLAILWCIDFINYHGEEMFLDFLEFINSMGISDLHRSNIGYIGDRPVLVDYSGFNN